MTQRSRNARRLAIAAGAARIIAEEGQRDYGLAKTKAAERLGYSADGDLPRNTEIEAALRNHLSLFSSSGDRHLNELRSAALEAMTFFESFSPRLVGAVLAGTADTFSAVSLHVFADSPEQLTHFLIDQRIPFEEQSRVVRVNKDESATIPVFKFLAGEIPMDVSVFPRQSLRQPPLSPIDGRPMQRANRSAVEALVP